MGGFFDLIQEEPILHWIIGWATPDPPPDPVVSPPVTPAASPTYSKEVIQNTVSSNVPIPIAFGKVKVGGNVIRASSSSTTRAYLVSTCEGEIDGFSSVFVNDIAWADLNEYNLLSNGKFTSNTEHWNTSGCGGKYGGYLSCSIASVAGGQSGNCLELTRINYDGQVSCQSIKTTTTKEYQVSGYLKQGTSGAGEEGKLAILDGGDQSVIASVNRNVDGTWTQIAVNFTPVSNRTIIHLFKHTATAGSMLFDEIQVRQLAHLTSKTEYVGNTTQTADSRFADKAQAYRSVAYLAFTFEASNPQIGPNPTITSIIQAKKCVPIAGGAASFTRNPAVILWHIYTQLEGRSIGDLDQTVFQSLETYCDATPTGGTIARYRFDYTFDSKTTINDIKKKVWSSFHGGCTWSQGKVKPVWEAAKASSFAFTQDNIVTGSFSWNQREKANIFRINFINSDNEYKKDTIELRDETSITDNGEIIFEETCNFITDEEIARRRCQFRYDKSKYTDYACKLTSFPESSKLEILERVTVTHTLPGWTAKSFIIKSKSQDEFGRCTFELEAYYANIYDDLAVPVSPDYYSNLPNPYAAPAQVTGVTLAEDFFINKNGVYTPVVNVEYAKPTNTVFWSHAKIWVRVDSDSSSGAWVFYGDDYTTGTGFMIDGVRAGFGTGDTVIVKVQSMNENGIAAPFEDAPASSVSIELQAGAPPIVKGLRIENKTTDYSWDGRTVTIVWRGGSAGSDPAGQEPAGAGGTIDPNWKYDEVQIFTGGILRHTFYTKELRYTYIYGDGQDDFLDSFVIAAGGTITFKVYRWSVFNTRSVVPAVISISNQNPATPIGLSSVGFLSGAEFSWTSAAETDWSHYSVRTGVEGAVSSAWKTIYDTYFPYYMSSSEYITYGTTATIHFDTKAVDLYNNESSIQSTSVAASGITTVQITKRSISAPKILANTITATEIAARSITGDRLAVSAVTADVIAASSVTASHIYGAGFGNLTISAGVIQLSSGATIGLSGTTVEIQDGADLMIQGGGDIILQTSTTDPGLIQWTTTGSGVSFSFGSSSAGNRGLRLWPEIANLERIYFGRDLADNLLPFYSFSVESWNSVYLRSMKGSGSTTGIITIDNNNAGCTTSFRITNNNKGGTQRLELAPKGGLMTGHFLPKVDSAYTLGNNTLCWSDVFADAGITACSGRKYKTNIRPETLGLDFINALQPVEFEWNKAEGKTNTGKFRGIIAQDVEAVLDEVGYKDIFAGVVKGKEDDGSDWYGFRYEQLIAPIVKAIQDLEEKKANK